jgi:heterodisulfide reductase subunit B
MDDAPITICSELAQRIMEELGQNVYLCYQCVRCSSGCPVSSYFDLQPNQIMRAAQLGQEEMIFQSVTPWLCASCQTCTSRCPQGLDIAAIMDYMTRLAVKEGYTPKVTAVKVFNEAFMREVRLWGRSYELGLLAELKLRTLNLFSDLDLAVRLLQKNKMPFFPHPVHTPHHAKRVTGASTSVAYYPGCSLHSTAKEMDISTRAMCEALEINLVEPKGWVCCGSSAAHRFDPEAALRLPLTNLTIIEQSGFKEVTMPCAACFSRHKVALHEIRQHPAKKAALEQDSDYTYHDTVQVNSIAMTILNRVGAAGMKERVKRPLKDLHTVCYYGCLLTRPPEVTEAEHPENPTFMDELVRAMGAEVVDWSYKTACCGASHSLTRPDIVLDLSHALIDNARKAGAEAIVVACPLCHTNLDARQTQMAMDKPMPVFYFTQLAVLAMGLPVKMAALEKNLVDPRPLLRTKSILSE